MVEMTVDYQGELRSTATHGPSKAKLNTDAPLDNMGKGESFSPTDLVGTALATCMLTTMGIYAKRKGFELTGATARVTKEMATSPVRRIARLTVTFNIPDRYTPEQRSMLENAAKTCPVHKSLSPDVEMPITFNWMKQ